MKSREKSLDFFHRKVYSVSMKKLIALFLFASTTASADVELPSTNAATCLANNIYFEAKGQSKAGQIAVGLVVMNRMKDSRYPDTVCEVVYQAQYSQWWKDNHNKDVPVRHRCQFSWFCDGKSDKIHDIKSYARIYQLSTRILSGRYDGMLEGATHYHADYVNPSWNKEKTLIGQIGDHIFYRWD